jgi:hypothetical protein
MSEIKPQPTTTLYRVENPVHPEPRAPNGETSHEDLVGQWFSPNLSTAVRHLRKNTQTFGKNAKPVDGAQLVIVHVPQSELPGLHVSQHETASGMDVENDNYIIPRDGSYPEQVIGLDDIVGDLRGRLGNYENFKEAKQRIHRTLGLSATT